MSSLRYFVVDVFAEEKYAGNQLAVFVDSGDLPDSIKQRIAKETNYSETTFVSSKRRPNGGYDVRIFTPATELPFAGHPTLGTAYVIRQEIVREQVSSIVLNEQVGQIPVTFSGDVLWMKQIPPVFGSSLDTSIGAQALGLTTADFDPRFPIQQVSTGIPFGMVPLKTLAAVKRARPRWDQFTELTKAAFPRSILVFAKETYNPENDLNVRVFVDEVGVPEDPATGSGNGCLAGYLVKHRYFGKPELDIRVEQGYEIGRPSLLFLRAADKGDSIEVMVGGHVVMVAQGEFVQETLIRYADNR
jgi:trans-2,3-dihydro-3-hydroxyanthranilate isomerase